MKKITLLLFIIMIGFNTNLFADSSKKIKRISEGKDDAKIIIFAYESFTCGHCADFHKNVYSELKKDLCADYFLNKISIFEILDSVKKILG